MASLVSFSDNKLSQMGKYVQYKGMFGMRHVRETVRFFKLKVCQTFDDLFFADITPLAVSSGGRETEK